MPRFAANLSMMFTEWPFLDRFEQAALAGFDAVEYLFPYAFDAGEIASRLKQFGLTQALFNLPPGDFDAGERGLASLAGREQEFREGVETALHYARATGVRRLHMMAGLASAGDAPARARYVEALTHVADRAGAEGIDIVIEPINKRDMPGYFLNDFELAAEIIAACGVPNVRLQFDIYHRQIMHGDVIMGLRRYMPIIGHVQVAAVPQRSEPGSGELDDSAVFAELDRLGYSAFVGCEYRPAAGTLKGLGWFAPYRAQ
jgi:hydroxypyruvate isomerase